MPRRVNPSPWLVGAGVVGGGLALGLGAARLFGRPSCDGVGPEGGTVAGVPYLERIRGNAEADEALPMVVLLHSLDGSPKGYAGGMGGIGRARLVVPQGGYDSPYGGYRWFPTGLRGTVQDGFTDEEYAEWNSAGDRLAAFVAALARCRPTIGEPIITGSSQGGEMALLLATRHRRQIHGAVVVNADLPDRYWGGRIAPTIWIHGMGDTTVPYDWARAHAMAATERGAPIRFEAYPSSGHDITQAMSYAWRSSVEAMVAELHAR